MKLKNKQTGEIVDTLCEDITKGMVLFIDHHDGNPTTEYYNSLAELNEEWEDYEEPKEHWMINAFGDVETVSGIYTDDMIDELREIGNYFETEEKAKLAVRKLKAWKRLKDLGAKFNGYNLGDLSGTDYIGDEYLIELDGLTNKELCELESYLDLLFGGEE